LVVGFVLWVVALGSVRAQSSTPRLPAGTLILPPQAQAQQPPASPVPGQQPGKVATYVGTDSCIQCHDDQRKGFEGTPHGRATDWRAPAARQGCETCHGPGSLHVDDPAAHPVKIFRNLPPQEVNATCASCHNRGEHALWDASQHESRNLSCTTCHSVHSFKSPTGQLKAPRQQDVCASCHRDKVAKIDRSGHMPVREGKMQCSTCHNPHGATNVKLLRKGDSIGELCTSCHADKRGPFLWEHPPGRDGCVTCHDPHGSSNERMLVSKPPILCQRCHIATRHPSTIYDATLIGSATPPNTPSARIFARSCVICHSAIHGSNHPSGQRFIR
jgi:DmsE family decaheme c-type cytochrome